MPHVLSLYNFSGYADYVSKTIVNKITGMLEDLPNCLYLLLIYFFIRPLVIDPDAADAVILAEELKIASIVIQEEIVL